MRCNDLRWAWWIALCTRAKTLPPAASSRPAFEGSSVGLSTLGERGISQHMPRLDQQTPSPSHGRGSQAGVLLEGREAKESAQ